MFSSFLSCRAKREGWQQFQTLIENSRKEPWLQTVNEDLSCHGWFRSYTFGSLVAARRRLFDRIIAAKQISEASRREYNESRPHRALGERTPSEFACHLAIQGSLTSS